MKLIINKFPPIVEKCEIDLSKKLTLFVGKNNSGKTYISQLIWAIYDFSNYATDYWMEEYASTNTFIDLDVLEYSNDTFSQEIEITQDILDNFSKNFSKYLIDKKIKKVFKQDIDANIEVKLLLSDINNKIIQYEASSGTGWKLEYKKEQLSSSLKIILSGITKDNIESIPIDTLNRYLESEIIKGCLVNNSVYMPSTRLFLPSFYKYIISIEKEFKDDVFSNFDKLDDKNKSFFQSTYTEPVYNLIKKLIFDIDKPIEKNEYLTKLTALIDGDISIDKSEELGMADISYTHSSGKKLPMYLSSSMVNQLATVYLYFKYWYQKDNSFLLLDEPEMNLHPEKKIEFTRILLDYASSNKLLIATHSSTLAKSIINYIHLFDLKDKLNDKEMSTFIDDEDLKMDSSINLVSNDVGIYYFNGRTITSYKKDNNSNIHFGTFTEIEELQKKQYECIMDELEE